MSNTETKYVASFPFAGMLALVFITLKLTGHIDWSWWWVLSPIWIPFVIAGAVVVVILACALGATIYESFKRGRK